MSDNRFYKSKWPPEDTSRTHHRKSFEKSSNSINNLLAYYESNSANGAATSSGNLNASSSQERGPPVGRHHQPRQRRLSGGSSSSSDYSVESDSVDEHFSITSGDIDDSKSSYTTSTATSTGTGTHKRSNMPSVGGADRRRLAIVQMETLQEAMSASGTSSTASSIRSRRGLSTNLAGLALVAPPDASKKAYTHLTPPTTTTAGLGGNKEGRDKEGDRKHGQGHQRREGQHTPRDSWVEDENKNRHSLTENKHTYHYERSRSSPMERSHPLPTTTPATRPTPNPYEAQRAMLTPASARGNDGHSALSSAFPSSTLPTPLITPEIGAGKEIHIPVAAPVVVDLAASTTQTRMTPVRRGTTDSAAPHVEGPVHGVTASTVFDPLQTSGFVNYKPGVHATAGPLPPPPRLIDITPGLRTPPPPRPPRLHSPAPPKPRTELEAMKQALQLPPAVAAKLAKTSPAPTPLNPLTGTSTPKCENVEMSKPSNPISDNEEADSSSSSLQPTRSTHRREGAFLSSPRIPQSESSSRSSLSTTTAAPLPQSDISSPALTVSTLFSIRQLSSVDDDNDVPSVTIVAEEGTATAQEDDKAEPPTADAIEALTKDDHGAHDHSDQSGGEEALSTSTTSTSPSMLSKQRRISWTEATSFRRHSRTPSGTSSRRGGVSLEDNGPSPKLSRSLSVSTSRSSNNSAPSPPPKSFRNSLTTSLKRFSTLPRAPSLSASRSSKESKRSSNGTHYSTRSTRTPSPSPRSHHKRVKRKKTLEPNPAAMFCHEVYQQRTTAERCAIYTAKINELYWYDCGLSDWLIEMKYRTANPAPRGPTTSPFVPKPRQTSRASMVSEATFPRRPDAVAATDLSSHGHSSSSHTSDVNSPVSLASSLPYPSLAAQSRQQSLRSAASLGTSPPSSSVRSLTSSSNGHSGKTGFFASLGRKASLQVSSKRAPTLASLRSHNASSSSDHGHGGHHGRNLLSKTPPVTKNDISRPVQIATNHSAPSGPRALHSSNSTRVQRSQTLMPPPKSMILDRSEAIGRRPSLFNINTDASGMVITPTLTNAPAPDPEFAAQVEKLHTLLPHADRQVLAGYLRRSGQDVLAIGQFLEDEKNGTLRYI